MSIRTILLFLFFFLLSGLAMSAIACPPPPCGDCQTWNPETEACDSDCSSGQCCNDDVCVDDCDDCYTCESGSCDWDCSPLQECCNGTCCDYCCDGVCCSSGQSCCDNECCDNPCCGTECCGANQYCCGGETCCNSDEVCCWYFDGGFTYYCNPPCTDEVTDTTSCSEDNEDAFKCKGCQQITSPSNCGTYQDYTGLVIETCHDGCPQFDWNNSEEICYEVKECFPMFHSNSLCLECEGEMLCLRLEFGEPPECQTIGECIVTIVCDVTENCYQCESGGGDTVYTHKEETCSCK